MCNYHVNDPTTFLDYQIQVCSAHARMLASGYKSALSVLPVHGLMIFQHPAQIRNLYRPPYEIMKTEMSKLATQRQ